MASSPNGCPSCRCVHGATTRSRATSRRSFSGCNPFLLRGPVEVPSAPVTAVLARLKKVKKAGKGWVVLCPAHDDTKRSLSVGEGRDGRVLLNCHANKCAAEQIMAAIGLTSQDMFPDSGSRPAPLPPSPRQR